MPTARQVLIPLSVLCVGGSLTWTVGSGLHLRSEAFRLETERDLTEFFELPCDVGRVRGVTFSSRRFEDVTIWLPDRRDRVFTCRSAVWSEKGSRRAPANELDLSEGILALGTDRWLRGDYRQLLRSGLGHDFEDLHLDRMAMSKFEVSFVRGDFSVTCREVSGTIDMKQPGDGLARLHAYELNGHRVSEGVQIFARFSPRNGLEISELVLTLPELPLAAVKIGSLLGGTAPTGRFAGSLRYVAGPEGPEVWVVGDMKDVALSDVTRPLPIGPLEGVISIGVDEARVARGMLTHLRGRGRIREMTLNPFATLLKRDKLAGRASLNIDDAELSLGRVHRLRLSGLLKDLLIDEWLAAWGHGSATGRLSIRINNLDLVEEEVKSADVEIHLAPRQGEAGYIDRRLLLILAERAFRFTWPEALPQDMLPDRIHYKEVGVRLLVRDNRLRILGTHGDDGRTILTAVIFGMPVELVHEPKGTIDLGAYVVAALNRIRGYDPQAVRQWFRPVSSRPADQPSAGDRVVP